MPRRYTRAPAVALVAILVAPAAGQDAPARRAPKGQAWEQDEYEEKTVRAATERAIKAADTEAGRWLREMTRAFPDRVPAPLTEAALDKWFDLLAGGARVWRREDSASRQIADLFDRAAQRLELGPVPALRRDEFQRFGKRLLPRPREAPRPGEQHAEADRVFRVLDRDGSGSLEVGEWTDRHRADARKADLNDDRRIDPAEYRAYFAARVTDGVEGAAKAAKSDPAAAKGGLPGWFTDLDTDADGQVGLYEWRVAGRAIGEFTEMDGDGDGLLTPGEYRRYAGRAVPPTDQKADPMTSPMAARKTGP